MKNVKSNRKPSGYWSEQKIIETFNDLSIKIPNRLNINDWKRAGYSGMINAISKIWGWPIFLCNQGYKYQNTGKPNKKWDKILIEKQFKNPPKSITDPTNLYQWTKNGYGGMISAIYDLYVSKKIFLEEIGIFTIRYQKAKIQIDVKKSFVWTEKYIDWEMVKKILPGKLVLSGKNRTKATPHQIKALLIEVQNGNSAAKEILISLNTETARFQIFIMGDEFRFSEHIQNAALRGLSRGIERADPERYFSFGAYIKTFIYYAILKEKKRLRKIISLDTPIRNCEDEKISIGNSLADPTEANNVFNDEMINLFHQVLDGLNISERDKKIVKERLLNYKMTLAQIARTHNLRRERVRIILKDVMPIIRCRLISLKNCQNDIKHAVNY